VALTVKDPYGLLPGNPAQWPEELKRAIARCCCGDSGSSSSSSTTTTFPTTCGCAVGETVTATLSGALGGINGSYPLRYTTDPVKLGRVNFAFPGWVSDGVLHPFTCTGLGGGVISYKSYFGFSTECGITWRQWYSDSGFEGVAGQMFGGVGPCLLAPISCNPLYIARGMVNFTSAHPASSCIDQEPNHTCGTGVPPFTGPRIEITL